MLCNSTQVGGFFAFRVVLAGLRALIETEPEGVNLMDGTRVTIVAARLLPVDQAQANAVLLSRNINAALGYEAAQPHLTGHIVLDQAAAASLLLAELRVRRLLREAAGDVAAFVRLLW
jgi:hypothetical protein